MANVQELAAKAAQEVAQQQKERPRFDATVISVPRSSSVKSNGKQYYRYGVTIVGKNGKTVTQFADRNLHVSDEDGKLKLDEDNNPILNEQPKLGDKVSVVANVVPDETTGEMRPFFSISLGIATDTIADTMAALGL